MNRRPIVRVVRRPAHELVLRRSRPGLGARLPIGYPATNRTNRLPLQKDLQMRQFRKRLKGFEPSTFCMASSRSAAPSVEKPLQIGASGRLDGRFAFQELCAVPWGLDNEQTMSDADGGRTGDEAAIWPRTALKLHRSNAYRITTARDRVVCMEY
jgi:hypothetical protein